MARDRVESGFSRFDRNARRQAYHGPELPGVALTQHVVPELRSEDRRDRDRDEQLSQILAQGAVKVLRSDSYDGCLLPIQPQRLSHRVRRGVEAIAPETIADHHHWRVAGLVKFWVEQPPTLGLDAEH